MFKCPFCNYENENLDSVRIHSTRGHKKSSLELRLALFHDDVRPKCKCGCGEETKFINVHVGFNDFIRGHHSRVNNNWGHNSKAREKSLETRREMWDKGEIHIWTKGKTKNDPDVARMIETGRQTILSNPEEIKKRSNRMRGLRLSGTIPTQSGVDHPGWKGGVSTVQQLARSYVYNTWTRPKLLASNFTCQHCGTHDNLCVHHDGERFAEILQKARAVLGDVQDSFESHQSYARWVADYHTQNNVSGVVLCESCHAKVHAALGETGMRD